QQSQRAEKQKQHQRQDADKRGGKQGFEGETEEETRIRLAKADRERKDKAAAAQRKRRHMIQQQKLAREAEMREAALATAAAKAATGAAGGIVAGTNGNTGDAARVSNAELPVTTNPPPPKRLKTNATGGAKKRGVDKQHSQLKRKTGSSSADVVTKLAMGAVPATEIPGGGAAEGRPATPAVAVAVAAGSKEGALAPPPRTAGELGNSNISGIGGESGSSKAKLKKGGAAKTRPAAKSKIRGKDGPHSNGGKKDGPGGASVPRKVGKKAQRDASAAAGLAAAGREGAARGGAAAAVAVA
ncbi:unnamed protein product, partial [Sphacelaria rigidula]